MIERSDPQPNPQLDALVSRLCARELSAEQAAELMTLLENDERARESYVRQMNLHAELMWRLSGSRIGAEAPQVTRPETRAVFRRIPPSARFAALAACLLLAAYFIGMVVYVSLRNRAGQAVAELEAQPQVATLGDPSDVKWSNEISPKSQAAPIRRGETLKIESGLVELQLKQGATLLVQGPAEWSIDGENQARLKRGKLVANVPQKAVGFTLDTPKARIVDLGTEFGVEVKPNGAADVHVSKGKVDVQSAGGSAKPGLGKLQAGQSMQITAEGAKITSNPAIADKFKRLTDAGNKKGQVASKSGSPLERWREASQKLRKDSSLVAYYDFESQGVQLQNVVADKLHGEIITEREKVPWTQGRWYGKHALAFGDDFAAVSIADDPALHPKGDFAFAVWFRVDRDPAKTTALILGKGNFPKRSYTLFQFPATGLLTSVGRAAGGHYAFGTNKPLQTGQWYFVVCTYDSGVMCLYLDGVEVAGAKQMDSGVTIDDQPLMLGLSREVGAVPFTGVIDEVAIFRRALSAADVAEMYRTGKP